MESSSAWESFPSDLETLCITASSNPENFASKCIVTPIITSSNFLLRGSGAACLENGTNESDGTEVFEYGRHGNPTRNHLEHYFAKLEGSNYALAFGSGVAGLGAVVLSLDQGDHIVSSLALYGGSTCLLREVAKYGISVDFFETTKTDDIVNLIKSNTKMVFLESPSNPDLRLLDIADISKKVHAINPKIIVAVDNTFLTPVLQNCLKLGADMVLYSTSKYIGGHADLIGGMVTMNNPELFKKVKRNQEIYGGIPSPFDCYMAIRSLKTLPLRLEKHSKNALKVATFLMSHPSVEKVFHPGLKSHPQHALALKQQKGHSGMLGFYVKGGYKEAAKFMESVNVIKRAPSLGADISLVTIPAKMSHIQLSQEERCRMGITDNYIRLSVGLEGAKDLINDLDQALKKAVI